MVAQGIVIPLVRVRISAGGLKSKKQYKNRHSLSAVL